MPERNTDKERLASQAASAAALARRDLIRAEPDEAVAVAARRMHTAGCSSVVVMDGDQAVGVWTEADAVRLNLSDPETRTYPLRSVMSCPVLAVPGEATVAEARAQQQAAGVRHLLVTDNAGTPVGILTQSDLVGASEIEAHLRLRPVHSAIRQECLRLSAERRLSEAARRMAAQQQSAAVVEFVDGDPGIVTERDVVRVLAEEPDDPRLAVVANRPLVTVSADDSLLAARERMIAHGIRRLGVTDTNGRLVGLVGFPELLATGEAERIRDLEAALADTRARLQAEEHERRRLERQADEIYEEMFRRNVAPKLLIDPDTGAIADANPAALAFYGYTQEAIRGQRIQDINLLSESEVQAEWEKARREERRYFEFRHRLASGEIRDVKVYSGPVLIDGKTYLHSIIHDVTDANRYRDRLERYRTIFDTLPVGVYRNRAGGDGRFEEVNPATARIFGAESVAEFLCHSAAELYRDSEERQRFSEELLARGEVHQRELDLQTLDGRPIRAAITARVRYTEQGEPVFDGVVEDVTERYRAEQERNRLLESLAEGVFGIDTEGRFTFLNPVGCRLLGVDSEADVLGRNAHAVSHHSRPDGHPLPENECPIQKVLRSGDSLEAWEDWFWHQDGTGFPVEVFAAPLVDTDGEVDGAVVTFVDISERKALEHSLLKYRAAFEQSRDAVLFLDGEAFLEGNSTTLKMFGVESEEAFRALRFSDVAPPFQPDGQRSADAAQARIREAFEHGRSFFAWRHRTVGAREFPAEVLLSRIDHADQPLLQAVVRDVTRREEARAARDRVLAILDATPDIVSMSRVDGTVTYINRAGLTLWGEETHSTGLDNPPPEWMSEPWARDAFHPEWAQRRINEEGMPAARRYGVWHGETSVFDGAGREIPVSQVILAHYGADGEVARFSTIIRDISEQRELERHLREEMAFSQAVVRNLPGLFYMIDEAGRFVRWNRHFEEVTGCEGDNALAHTPPAELFPAEEQTLIQENIEKVFREGSTTVEAHLLSANGEVRPYYLTGYRVDLGDETYLLGVGLDISRRKAMERELERLATHDPLTGLYNRAKLYELLERAGVEYERYGTPFSVIMFDIDHFKRINDRFGHQVGDDVLCEMGRRISDTLRDTDAVGRWGGEEFLVLATHTGAESAVALAERIRARVAESPFEDVGLVTISVGVATYGADEAGETLKRLEERADDALYAAKEAGRNRVVVAEEMESASASGPNSDP